MCSYNLCLRLLVCLTSKSSSINETLSLYMYVCMCLYACVCVSASGGREFLKMLQTNPEVKSWRKNPLPLEINYFQALTFWSQLLFSPKQSNCVDIELSMGKNSFGLIEIQSNDCHSCYYMDNNVLSFSSKKVKHTVTLLQVALSELHRMIHVLLKAFYQWLLI